MRFNRFRRKKSTRLANQARGANRLRRTHTLEVLEGRELLTAAAFVDPLHNYSRPQDVNHDGRVSPVDALIVINDLLQHGSHTVSTSSATPNAATVTPAASAATSYLDVNGDGRISPIDALQVINQVLNQSPAIVTTFATDLSGNPITSVPLGGTFLVETDVTDNRSPASSNPGVFSAYANFSYDPSLAAIATGVTQNYTDLVIDGAHPTNITSAAHPFTTANVGSEINVANEANLSDNAASIVQSLRIVSVDPVTHIATCNAAWTTAAQNAITTTGGVAVGTTQAPVVGPLFQTLNLSHPPNANKIPKSLDLSTSGVIPAVGALSTSSSGTDTTQQKLYTFLATATAAGIENFVPSFDSTTGDDFTLFLDNTPLTADQIQFTDTPLTIVAPPKVSVTAPAPTNEGNSGTTPFVFTVSLSNAAFAPVTVAFTTVDGTATVANNDYVPTSGTLTFAINQTSQLVTVLVVGDTNIEPNETFSVALSNVSSNASIDPINGSATATILMDDFLPTLAVNNVAVTRPASGSIPAVFTVTVAGAVNSPVTVVYSTSDVSAQAGTDYTATSGTLTFVPAGATTQNVTVSVLGNPNPVGDETFQLDLSSPSNASVTTAHGIGTIHPFVALPTVSITPSVSLPEGNSGTTPFVFTVSLSAASSVNAVVTYTTADGTATVGNSDYLATSGTLTFTPGQTSQTVTVLVVGDTATEPNETFQVNITSVSGATGNPTGTGTILNDDGTATVTILPGPTVVAGPSGTNALFTVNISSVVAQPVTVSFATQDFTAKANTDYLAQSGILTFDVNHSLSQVITVPILGTATAPPPETFFVNLSSVTGNGVLGSSQSTGTIVRQGLLVSNASVDEGNVGDHNQAVFTVSLNAAQDHPVTVVYSTADGSATTANNDYVPTSGTLTFATGVTTQTVSVAIVGDNVVEPNETFSLNLSNPVGSVLLTSTGTGTIINDDGVQGQVRVVLADTNDVALSGAINVNDPFVLEVFVKDVQAIPTGVFQEFVNALYDSNLVKVATGGTITFGAAFTNSTSGSLATLGQVIDAGGISGLTPPGDPTAEELLFSVPMVATNNGLANFTVGASTVQGHDMLLYQHTQPVPVNSITFVGASLNIGQNVFVVDNVSHNEGNSNTTPFVFTITRLLPPNPADTVTVQYTTVDGTATTADNDYQPTSGTLTFSPTDLSETVTVLVNGDTKDEPDETFSLKLSNPSGTATVSGSPGIGTIVNDDAPSTISVATPDAAPEGQNLNFTVSLNQASGKTVTVVYSTASLAGDTATAGLDYTPTSGTLTFLPGDLLQQTVSVALLPDVLVEPTETFHLVLSNPVNGTLATAQAVGSILDVPPAIISGYVYIDANNNGLKDNGEAGIAGVNITAIRSGNNATATTTTGADGSYTFAGLQPGTWSVIETQPGFYVDGRDTHNGVDSPLNDEFTGINVLPSQTAGGYDFGEQGLRAQFAATFINRRAYFASSIVTGELGAQVNPTAPSVNLQGGDVWVSFDGGWDGARIIQAAFNAALGSASMTLYDNNITPIAYSTPSAAGSQLQFTGVLGGAYFLRVTGTNPSVALSVTGGPTGSSISSNAVTPSATPAASPTTTAAVTTATTTTSTTSTTSTPTATSPSATDLALAQVKKWVF